MYKSSLLTFYLGNFLNEGTVDEDPKAVGGSGDGPGDDGDGDNGDGGSGDNGDGGSDNGDGVGDAEDGEDTGAGDQDPVESQVIVIMEGTDILGEERVLFFDLCAFPIYTLGNCSPSHQNRRN